MDYKELVEKGKKVIADLKKQGVTANYTPEEYADGEIMAQELVDNLNKNVREEAEREEADHSK